MTGTNHYQNTIVRVAARNAGFPVRPGKVRDYEYVAREDGPRFDPYNNLFDAWRLVSSHGASVRVTVDDGVTTVTVTPLNPQGEPGVANVQGDGTEALCRAIVTAFYQLKD